MIPENNIEQTNDELVVMFGDKEARWFQIAARNQVEDILESNPIARILVQMPTGVGKTVTSGLIFTSQRIRTNLGLKDNEK